MRGSDDAKDVGVESVWLMGSVESWNGLQALDTLLNHLNLF